MNNIGRKITDPYCNGYFGRDYDLCGAEIIEEEDEYIVIRKENGVVDFCNLQSWDWNRSEDGSLSGGVSNLKCMDQEERQELIDSWCGDE